jgi:hypothetical protein
MGLAPRRSAVATIKFRALLKVLPITAARAVRLSLFRRRQLMSRRKEGYLASLRDALKN